MNSERKSRLLGNGEITVSFEFFPPKTPEGVTKLAEARWSNVLDFVQRTVRSNQLRGEHTLGHAHVIREQASRPSCPAREPAGARISAVSSRTASI